MKITRKQLRRIIKEAMAPLPMDLVRRGGGYTPKSEKDPYVALRDAVIALGKDAENTFAMLVLDLNVEPGEVANNFPPLASIISKIDKQTLVDVAESL